MLPLTTTLSRAAPNAAHRNPTGILPPSSERTVQYTITAMDSLITESAQNGNRALRIQIADEGAGNIQLKRTTVSTE